MEAGDDAVADDVHAVAADDVVGVVVDLSDSPYPLTVGVEDVGGAVPQAYPECPIYARNRLYGALGECAGFGIYRRSLAFCCRCLSRTTLPIEVGR